MFNHLRKTNLENRLARLRASDKENGNIQRKIVRELRKFN